ncbi:MAG: slipin family protein [Alphaproteobacteria bacterium]|nr:slipin family protein [Alphaproteobacteria bacterium]MCB1551357.1 slipin family protein [Alphaproteobacteria bacterium]MCB9984926.1 slipin family protein [Micavibrio sp.]HPQ50474.1 slipin family protein [Alphaproteobacteria bacterium]HRK97317.1 slipin family protein [Alphaproteobacteria bacterium]
MTFIPVFLVIILVVALASIRIIKEYERGVIYTLGKYTGTRGAGIQLVLPVIQTMTIVDVRVRTDDIPAQDLISKDNVSVKVSGVLNYRVVDPAMAINRNEDFLFRTNQMAQTTLRSVLGQHDLDDMLQKRADLNKAIQGELDGQTEGSGIKVISVEIKHVDIDPSMIRAIARQAEAERERRAKIINAEGELQAAKQLDEAATILAQRPETMQLRYLGTLGEFANNKGGSTIVLPLPMNLLHSVGDLLAKK